MPEFPVLVGQEVRGGKDAGRWEEVWTPGDVGDVQWWTIVAVVVLCVSVVVVVVFVVVVVVVAIEMVEPVLVVRVTIGRI